MERELIAYDEVTMVPGAEVFPAVELVRLTPEQLDRHVDVLLGEVHAMRSWLEDRQAALRRAQRVRNARAGRRRPIREPTFADL